MFSARNMTPLILSGLFALIILVILSAAAWSRAKAVEAAKAATVDINYQAEDDKLPVVDAVVEYLPPKSRNPAAWRAHP